MEASQTYASESATTAATESPLSPSTIFSLKEKKGQSKSPPIASTVQTHSPNANLRSTSSGGQHASPPNKDAEDSTLHPHHRHHHEQAAAEDPSESHRRVQFNLQGEGDEHPLLSDPPLTASSSGLDTIILDTLLWMSGTNAKTRQTSMLDAATNRTDMTASGEDYFAAATPALRASPAPSAQMGYPQHERLALGEHSRGSGERNLSLLQQEKYVEDENEMSPETARQQQPHTPVQRRIPALYAPSQPVGVSSDEDYLDYQGHKEEVSVTRMDLHQQHQQYQQQQQASSSSDHLPTGSAGLVSTARRSSSADAASHSQASSEPVTIQPRPSILRKENHALAAEVGGAQWQHHFTAHAEKLLRESQKQVEVLRSYQAKAAREAQRADQLSEAQRILEEKLAAAEKVRVDEEQTHKAAVKELSEQVLQLDALVSALRRTQVDLERQLASARSTVDEVKDSHTVALKEVTLRFENKLASWQSDAKQREDSWRRERQNLLDENHKLSSMMSSAEAARPRKGTDGSISPPPLPSDTGVNRVDVGTSTEVTAQISRDDTDARAAADVLEEVCEDRVSNVRVHPDVVAQQQLREQTLTSQLALLESRMQREVDQRRTAERQVMNLINQNKDLRTVAAVEPTSLAEPREAKGDGGQTQQTFPPPSPSSTHDGRLVSGLSQKVKSDFTTAAGGAPQQELAVSHEIQAAYEALQRECKDLLHRYEAQQRRSAAQWAAVASHLQPLLALVGVRLGAVDAASHPDVSAQDEEQAQGHGSVPQPGGPTSTTCAGTTQANEIICSLQLLVEKITEQRRVEAVSSAQEREAVRLSTLEHALQQADAQNRAHCKALEVTEAQLREARTELAQRQQRQHEILKRQQHQADAWHAAEVCLARVKSTLQRALRVYSRPLPRAVADNVAPVRMAGGKRVLTRGRKSPTLPSTASSSVIATGSEDASTRPSRVSCTETRSSSRASSASANEEDHTEYDAMVVRTGLEEQRSESSMSGTDQRMDEAHRLDVAGSTSSVTDKSTNATELERDLKNLEKNFRVLFAAWRTRQHIFTESQVRWRQHADEATATIAALQAKHKDQERHLAQQIRLLRSKAQSHTMELAQLKGEWAAAQEEQAAKHARERQQLEMDAANERDKLLRQTRAAETEVRVGEEALAKANAACDAQRELVKELHDALEEAVQVRDQQQRRQCDLNLHIEALEGRLQTAQDAETGLHALLTTAVSAMVRQLFQLHRLRHSYRGVAAMQHEGACWVRAVEHLLTAAAAADAATEAVPLVTEKAYTSATKAEGTSVGSASLMTSTTLLNAPAVQLAILPRSRLRAAVYAVMGLSRLQRRVRLRRDAVESSLSAASFSSPLYKSLAAVLASLRISAASLAFSVTAETSRRSEDVLPDLHLPPAHELVTPILPLLRTQAKYRGDVHGERGKVCFYDSGTTEKDADDVGAAMRGVFQPYKNLEAAPSASLLEHLLTVAQLDVHAPATRFFCADVTSSTAAGASIAQQAAQRTQWARAALQRSGLESYRGGSVLPSVTTLLPPKLALPLSQLIATSSQRRHQLVEVKTIVQRLVEQNQRLVAAVETQAMLDETRTLEVDSLAAQLALQQPRCDEVMSLQERVVQSHASFLQERRLRRDAEEELARLRQQQLQWAGEEAQWRREVYALNMELANTSSLSSTQAQPSVLSIRKDNTIGEGETTFVDADSSSALTMRADADVSPSPQQPLPRGRSSANGESTYVLHGTANACQKNAKGVGENEESYYRSLLRGHKAESAIQKAAETKLRYEPRHNIPTAEELTQLLRASPPKAWDDLKWQPGGVVAPPSNISALTLFEPRVVQQQRKGNLDGSTVVDSTGSRQKAFLIGTEAGAGTSSDTHIRMTIAPNQPKRPKQHLADTSAQVTYDSATSALPQYRGAPSINTGTALSAALSPSAHPQKQQQQQEQQRPAFTSFKAHRPAALHKADAEAKCAVPHTGHSPSDASQPRELESDEGQSAFTFYNVWAPRTATTATMTTPDVLSGDPPRTTTRASVPAAAPSQEVRAEAPGDALERSLTLPPHDFPAVRLSTGGLRSDTGRGSSASMGSGPTYFRPRST